ncbi:MAG: amidohydrolase family protein [Rhodospirillales bacterium]
MIDAPPNAPLCAAPDPSPRAPNFKMPVGACDSHAHICGPISDFAYSPDRIYTPPDCLLADYNQMLSTLGVEKAVLVQPSIYGTDNTVMLKAMAETPMPAENGVEPHGCCVPARRFHHLCGATCVP